MKRYYLMAFMIIFLVSNTQKLFSLVPAGLYITPKFIFSHDGNYAFIKEDGKKGYFNYLGGGFSLGYSVPTVNKSSPIRFEFEYMGRGIVGVTNDIKMHTLLGSVYFDINFFLTKEELTDETYKQTLLERYSPFTIYFGVSIGARINDYLVNIDTVNKIQNRYSRSTIVFGFSGGMAFNVLPYMSIDLGYRYLIDTKADGYHEALLGLRFKFPKI